MTASLSSHSRASVVLTLVFAVLIGLTIPTIAYAAPPGQTTTQPDELAQAFAAFVDLLLAVAVSGGVAYVLQMSAKWRDWQSPFKPLVVLAITAVLGGALSALRVLATVEFFATIPDWGRAFLAFIVVFVGSQLTYFKGFGRSYVPALGEADHLYGKPMERPI